MEKGRREWKKRVGKKFQKKIKKLKKALDKSV